MKVHEIILESEIDEGWKSNVAATALAALGSLSGDASAATKPDIKPAKPPIVQQVKQAEKPKETTALTPREILTSEAKQAGIQGPALAQLLAKASEVTNNFKNLEELDSTMKFKKYEAGIGYNPATKKPIPNELGNLYAGDGEKYKARGYNKLTGRRSYRTAGLALNLPLELQPELLAKPDIAAKVAVWYWKTSAEKAQVKPTPAPAPTPKPEAKKEEPTTQGLTTAAQIYKSYKPFTPKFNNKNESRDLLIKTATEAGITGMELAHLLAQSAHETRNFKFMAELHNGDPEEYFKKYETGIGGINPKTKKPIPNYLGNTTEGDGILFKGRGYLHLTGRENYERAGKDLGIDLTSSLKKARQASNPIIAAKIAVWFWKTRVRPEIKDFNTVTVKDVTHPINQNFNGLDDREEKFIKILNMAQETK